MHNFSSVLDWFPKPGSSQDKLLLRLLIGVLIALVVALLINKGLGRLVAGLARTLTRRAENTSKGDRLIQIKRTETVFSVGGAVARTLIVGACLYIAWRIVNPTRAPVALIGASTFFYCAWRGHHWPPLT